MCAGLAMRHSINPQVAFAMEVSGYLVGSAAFKAVGTSEPRLAGSIPVRLRQILIMQGARAPGTPSANRLPQADAVR